MSQRLRSLKKLLLNTAWRILLVQIQIKGKINKFQKILTVLHNKE